MAETSGSEGSSHEGTDQPETPERIRQRPSVLKLEREPESWEAREGTSANKSKDKSACRVRFKDDDSWKDETEEETEEVYETRGWRDVWREFCQHSTIGGLRQISEDTPFTLRRFIWIALVLLGFGLFTYQLVESVMLYLQHPVSVDVKINYNDTIHFPAVTICNQNTFRMTEAARHGWYDFLSDMYGQDMREFSPDKFHVRPSSMEEVYLNTAHRPEDLIVSCRWGQQDCRHADFEVTLTDSGVCYTFNSGRYQPVKTIMKTGANHGLRLLLNTEQYEYMLGPQEGGGIRFHLHHQREPPLVHDLGMAVAPGAHASAAVSVMQVKNLPPPHGRCDSRRLEYASEYSMPGCVFDCKARAIVEQCKCREFWIRNNGARQDDPAVCDLSRYFSCVSHVLDEDPFSRSHCDCSVPCEEIIYDPILTYGGMSNFDTESQVRTRQGAQVAARYREAREVAQRVTPVYRTDNTNIIDSLEDSLDHVIKALENVGERLAYSRTFCHNVSTKMQPRIRFHLQRALDGVRYVVHNNFVRGWEVINERTVHHLTTEFYESISACDRTIKHLQTLSSDEITARKIAYLIMDKEMTDRLELAIRSIDNITTAYYKFLEGSTISDYEYTPQGLYDKYLIPTSLLFNLTSKSKEYYENISNHLTGYVDSILTIKTILKEVHQISDFNETSYNMAREKFIHHSKRINYYLFLFSSRVVMKSEEIMDERIEQFRQKNATFVRTVTELQGVVASLSSGLMARYKEAKESLVTLSRSAQEYLSNTSHTKYALAEKVLSKNIQELVHSVRGLFREIHARGHTMHDWWVRMRGDLIAVWMAMIQEETTRPFYARLSRAVDEMSNNSESASYLRDVFAQPEMLGLPIKQQLQLSPNQFRKRLNADIPHMAADFENMRNIALFDKVMKETNILDALGTRDVEFLSAFETLSRNMKSFQRASKIDTTFFRENYLRLDVYMRDLSSHQVEQRPSYSLVQLLSDIGGSIGLFVGASVLTLFEFLDIFIVNYTIKKKARTRHKVPHEARHLNASRDPKKSSSKPNGRYMTRADRDTFV